MEENTSKIFETEVVDEDVNSSREYDFYKKLRRKTDKYVSAHPSFKFAGYVAAVPDVFYLIFRLAADSRVPASAKIKLACAVAYTIAPVDIIPDFIPMAGVLDDLIVCVTLLNRSLDEIDPEIIDEYWLGEGKVYDFIKSVLDKGDKLVGSRAWNSIKSFLSRHEN